jgi:hypothetical protein
MSGPVKVVLMILGALAAILIILQFVMGMLILSDPGSLGLRKAHQHSGYLTALISVVYIAWSLVVVARLSARREP